MLLPSTTLAEWSILWFFCKLYHKEKTSRNIGMGFGEMKIKLLSTWQKEVAWKWKILLQKLFQSIVNVVQHTTIIIAPKWPLKQREGACTFAGLKHKMEKNPFSWHDVHSLGESQRRLTNVRWFKESNRITRPNPVFFLKAYCSFYRILYIFSSFTSVFLLFSSVIFGNEWFF